MSVAASTASADSPAPASIRFEPWLLPGWIVVGAYWIYSAVLQVLGLPIAYTFFGMVIGGLALPALFTGWWFTNRRVTWFDRGLAFGLMVLVGAVTGLLIDRSVGAFGLMFAGVPIVLTLWLVWLTVAAKASRRTKLAGLAAVFCLGWGALLPLRMDGITGNQRASLHWRWTPTAESLYLAEQQKRIELSPALPSTPIAFAAGDWNQFRGPGRDGELRGVKIATDWAAEPPQLLWKQRIGPGWSSFAVIGDRVYTQEQRGELESVLCLDAATGKTIWVHSDQARFWDGQAGAGPRATPTFADSRLYTLGATGILNCRDAASGMLIWTHDTAKDSGAAAQMWGISNSPLVVDGLVIVWAGGPGDKGLLAYRTDDGTLAWSAAAGTVSYTSPQLAEIDGVRQVLFFSEQGLVALDPATGKQLWEFPALNAGIWRAITPRQVGPQRILLGSEDLGLVAIDIAHAGDTWKASEHLASRAMRPAYNDFVVLDGHVYGLDGGFACCADLESLKRKWKGGRYGHGQILLIADQQLLLILTETGEIALVRATPDKHEELVRIPGITGKTWNHPVIAHGRLFIRNDEEMACFALKLEPEAVAAARIHVSR
ncbi:MAG: PQQ-like beta-propeller repeat protein [Planctomycetaceae bacterium]|nr:PQQ-like beta-propeller repeat protein [Planctomycetaceae bacterium]